MIAYNRLSKVFDNLKQYGLTRELQFGCFTFKYQDVPCVEFYVRGTSVYCCCFTFKLGPNESFPAMVQTTYAFDVADENVLYEKVKENILAYCKYVEHFKRKKIVEKIKDLSKDFSPS